MYYYFFINLVYEEIQMKHLIIGLFVIINLVACSAMGLSSVHFKSMNNLDLCTNAMTNKSLSENDLSKLASEIQDRKLNCKRYRQAIYSAMSVKQDQINKMKNRVKPKIIQNSNEPLSKQRPSQPQILQQKARMFNLVNSRVPSDRDYRICSYREKISGEEKEVIIQKDDICESVKLNM